MVPKFARGGLKPADGFLATEEMLIGFVVVQEKFILQVEAPDAMTQEESPGGLVGARVPDMGKVGTLAVQLPEVVPPFMPPQNQLTLLPGGGKLGVALGIPGEQ